MVALVEIVKTTFHQIIAFVLDGDQSYFRHINQEWTTDWLDKVMQFATDFHRFGPWILVPIVYMIYKKREKAFPIIIGCVIAVGLSDIIAARVIKPFVQRDRPEISQKNVRLIVPSQKSFGFPSNHAANTFAAGFFLLATFPSVGLVGLFIAFLVSYSRVYVGVHFPLDVMGGCLVGLLCAALVYKFYMLVWMLRDPIRKSAIEPKSWEKRKL